MLHNAAPWIWGAGGEIVRQAGGRWQSALNSPESLEGLYFFLSLAQKGYVPAESLEKNTAQIEADFQAGKCAVFASGPWMIQRAQVPEAKGGFAERTAAKNLGVAPYPAGPKGRYTFFGGSNLALFNFSKNKPLAKELLKYLGGPEAQVRYAQMTGMLPALRSAWSDPSFQQNPCSAPSSRPLSSAAPTPPWRAGAGWRTWRCSTSAWLGTWWPRAGSPVRP